ncbi:rhodanese-like domain-containing protein [Myxococcota bacterium]|nr:rhodanese-like domain-containing protein [Myxococcota bacterium]
MTRLWPVAPGLLALTVLSACQGGAPASPPAATVAPSVAATASATTVPPSPASAAPAPADAATLAREPDVLFLDVRTPGEFAGGHVEGALNIPVGETARMAEAIGRKDRPVVLYCAVGGRSAQAMAALRAQGFTRLANGGGVDAAAAKTGRPIVR